MKLKLLSAAALMAAGIASTAHAGLFQPQEVDVDLVAGIATGDTQTARQADGEDFIGCGTRTFSDGMGFSFESGFCQARDAEEEQVTCFTQDPVLVNAIGRLDDTSYIIFGFTEDAPDQFTCNRVGSSTQSFYLRPDKHEVKIKSNNGKKPDE